MTASLFQARQAHTRTRSRHWSSTMVSQRPARGHRPNVPQMRGGIINQQWFMGQAGSASGRQPAIRLTHTCPAWARPAAWYKLCGSVWGNHQPSQRCSRLVRAGSSSAAGCTRKETAAAWCVLWYRQEAHPVSIWRCRSKAVDSMASGMMPGTGTATGRRSIKTQNGEVACVVGHGGGKSGVRKTAQGSRGVHVPPPRPPQ